MSMGVDKAGPTHEVFLHACRFMLADEELRICAVEKPHLHEWLMFPSMVLTAFSCELFLKCLLMVENKPTPSLHNLSHLYEILDSNTKTEIEKYWDAQTARVEHHFVENERITGEKLPRDLKTALKDCGDAFTLLRYNYEDKTCGKFYIAHLSRVLHAVVLDLTGWLEDDKTQGDT